MSPTILKTDVDAGETHPRKADSDGDGMPDGWERQHGLNPLVNDAAGGKDGDGVSNLRKFLAGTNPADPKSVPKTKSTPWVPLLLE